MSGHIVHLLRHGPPTREGLLLGHTDEPACNSDCPEILKRTSKLSVTAVISSDLSRSASQAAILAKRFGVPLTLSCNWRELNFGTWDGKPPHAVDHHSLAQFWNNPEQSPPPNGERWSELCNRVRSALSQLEHENLVVTHAGAMRAAISVLTGLDHHGVWAIDLPYRALLTLRIWPELPGQIIGLAGDIP